MPTVETYTAQYLDEVFAKKDEVNGLTPDFVVEYDGTNWPGGPWPTDKIIFFVSMAHVNAPPPTGFVGNPRWLWFRRRSS